MSKNVLILLDLSGSMLGQRFEIAKQTIVTILETLSDNDFFNVMAFSKTTNFLDECAEGGLLQATSRNKKVCNYKGTHVNGFFFVYSFFGNACQTFHRKEKRNTKRRFRRRSVHWWRYAFIERRRRYRRIHCLPRRRTLFFSSLLVCAYFRLQPQLIKTKKANIISRARLSLFFWILLTKDSFYCRFNSFSSFPVKHFGVHARSWLATKRKARWIRTRTTFNLRTTFSSSPRSTWRLWALLIMLIRCCCGCLCEAMVFLLLCCELIIERKS